MSSANSLTKLRSELKSVPNLDLIESTTDRKRFSRDFFDYSPVLQVQLKDCLADLVVRPYTVDAVLAVARNCKRFDIPLTLRGSGTGNYGQSVPLEAGVVMLMNALNQVRQFDPFTNFVTVEPGCLLRDLNKHLFSQGRQLRLVPSTWRSASVGGFFSGGSGGIGSVRWGFLRDPGHLIGLEIVTLQDHPEKLQLDANSAEALNHAYGTNGIITSLTISTAKFVDWQQVIIDTQSFSKAIDLLLVCANSAIEVNLCSLIESQISQQLPNWFGSSKSSHRIYILVAPDGLSTLERLAKSAGASFQHIGTENDNSGNGFREITWNHTTLHMRAVDPEWTYLQLLLPRPELSVIEKLKDKWGDDLLWHLEAVRQQGVQRLAALPLVKWKGRNYLDELIEDCRKLDIIIFNPHVITVEDGGLGVIDSNQVEAKHRYDPSGILNPGKLRGWYA